MRDGGFHRPSCGQAYAISRPRRLGCLVLTSSITTLAHGHRILIRGFAGPISTTPVTWSVRAYGMPRRGRISRTIPRRPGKLPAMVRSGIFFPDDVHAAALTR